jgi:hypothetical protein
MCRGRLDALVGRCSQARIEDAVHICAQSDRVHRRQSAPASQQRLGSNRRMRYGAELGDRLSRPRDGYRLAPSAAVHYVPAVVA